MRKLIFCLCCLLWAIPARADDLELDLECLQEAYPGFITGTETDGNGLVWFLTKSGGRLLYDDGKRKSHAELLENADIEDAMRQPYPLEPERPDLAPDEEPGRIRCYPLLKALYGADQRSVERGIVRTLFGGKIKVCLAAPAAEAFRRIDAAWRLRPTDPDLDSYFSPIYGYFWRAIAKTNRLSPHSFGIAVDLNPDKGPYWQWSKVWLLPSENTPTSCCTSEHGMGVAPRRIRLGRRPHLGRPFIRRSPLLPRPCQSKQPDALRPDPSRRRGSFRGRFPPSSLAIFGKTRYAHPLVCYPGESGGIGRRTGLRIQRISVGVQLPPLAPESLTVHS